MKDICSMEEIKFSIIVPVYNAEKYIEEAVNSILSQDYSAYEVILIDDGSKDRSGIILDKLHEQDSRITVIHILNQGVSHARNVGIEKATGDFLMFMDADDAYKKGALRTISQVLQKHPKTDFLCFGYEETSYENGYPKRVEQHSYHKEAYYCGRELSEKKLELIKNEMFGAVWSKVYRRKFIEENALRLREDMYIGEDFCFNLDALDKSSNFSIIVNPIYIYKIQNSESIIQKYNKNKYDQMYKMHLIRSHFINHLKEVSDLQKNAENAIHYVRICMSCFMDLNREECTMKSTEKKKYIRKLREKGYAKFQKEYLTFFSRNQKIVYCLYYALNDMLLLAFSKICFILKFKLRVHF